MFETGTGGRSVQSVGGTSARTTEDVRRRQRCEGVHPGWRRPRPSVLWARRTGTVRRLIPLRRQLWKRATSWSGVRTRHSTDDDSTGSYRKLDCSIQRQRHSHFQPAQGYSPTSRGSRSLFIVLCYFLRRRFGSKCWDAPYAHHLCMHHAPSSPLTTRSVSQKW